MDHHRHGFLRRRICVGIRKCRGRTGGQLQNRRVFWAEEAVPQENALCIYPSTCPIPIRRTGWKHRNCRPPPVDFEALRGGDTGEERERSRRLRPQPTALASLAPPLAISEESSDSTALASPVHVSFVSRRIDSGRYSSRFPRGPPIRAPLRISG